MKLLNLIIALAVIAIPTAVLGHHSRAEFSNETVEISGVLSDVFWQNPHIALHLEVEGENGETESWRIEGWSRPAALESSGVTPEMFVVGDSLIVAGRPSRRRQALLATNVLFADGVEAVVAPTEPYWNGSVIGTDAPPPPQVVNAYAENQGIYRAWYPAGNLMMMMRSFTYTDAAIASREAWDPIDNPIVRCEPPGLPVPFFHARPILFSEDGENIGLHHSYMDVRRTVHLDEDAVAEDHAASRLGYSVGRWEDGNTLVVETSGINYPYFHIDGTVQSDAVEITERYSLSDDQTRLDYQLTIEDPATLSQPATIGTHFLALDEPFEIYDCNVF
ncbi:MAG: DUF6152 family protein [Gammaproteobacteria bacterium]